MRTPIVVLVAALFFSGCTHYHAAPAGAPAPQPDRVEAPEPEPVEPLELDIGRPSAGKLLLQTNRPAYVAIFEIIPNRGVTLIYPAADHQRNMVISGLTWVPLWWSPRRVSASDRYIYAVAAEEPLRLSAETFEGGYFSRALGVRIFRAESPYATMRAISRTVVPSVAEEEWAEDAQVITSTYLTETYRTVRVHCPGGRVFEVPEDMGGRIWCPTRTRVVIVDASRPRTRDYPVGRPARPDSIYLGGRRIKVDPRPPRGPVGRIVADPSGRGRDEDRDRDVRRRAAERDDRDERDDRTDREEAPEKPEPPKRGRILDMIRDKQERDRAREEEKDREKEERDARRREAEEERRREAEEREARRREAEERRDDRKDQRRDEREARKDERDARKEERRA
jgi:hypothetical protein